MKKVLIIGLTGTLGGVETYIYNVIKFMNKYGLDIDFLIIGEKESVFQKEIEEIIGDGKRHFYFSPSLKKHPLKGMSWIKRFYDNKQYDVIYMNTCTAAREVYCEYSVKKYGTKLITHSHNGGASSKIKGINNNLFRHHATKVSDVRLACSEVAYKWMFDDAPGEKSIIPNGIDTDRFAFNQQNRDEIRKQLDIESKIVVGHVGRFAVQKNHQFFLVLADKLPDQFHFLLIGDGDTKAGIKAKIKDLGLDHRFSILPSQEDVEKYYSAMDVFVMPSLYEGLPIVAVEAQCNGLPCVFSDTVSRQTNITGNCKFLLRDDVEQWVKNMIGCGSSKRELAKHIIEQDYSIKNTANRIQNIIDSV